MCFRIVEGCEGRATAGGPGDEEIVRHLLLACGVKITLIVIGNASEPSRGLNDGGVGGYSQRFGDCGSLEDIDVAAGDRIRFNSIMADIRLVCIRFCCFGEADKAQMHWQHLLPPHAQRKFASTDRWSSRALASQLSGTGSLLISINKVRFRACPRAELQEWSVW